MLKQIHTMMRRYAFLAILMAATSFAVSCSKENRDKGPSTLPKEKVYRIYKSSRALSEMYISITGTWKTIETVTETRVSASNNIRSTMINFFEVEYAD